MNGSFDNYCKAYIKLLSEEIKNSHHFDNFTYKKLGIHPITLNELKNAIKNAVYIYGNEDDKNLLYDENLIITESPGTLDYPETLCDKILSCKNGNKIKGSFIHSYLNPSWKYYKKFLKAKNLKDLLILKFNFENLNEINENSLNLLFSVSDKEISLVKILIEGLIKEKSLGIFIPFDTFNILMFNTKNEIKRKTILHEFTHYLQHTFNVEKTKSDFIFDINQLNALNLTQNEKEELTKIITDKNEIIPYINEFCEDIENVYKKFNVSKLMQKQIFIDHFLSTIFNSSNVKEEKLFKLYHKLNNDIFPLYVVYCCKIFNIKWKKFKEIILK